MRNLYRGLPKEYHVKDVSTGINPMRVIRCLLYSLYTRRLPDLAMCLSNTPFRGAALMLPSYLSHHHSVANDVMRICLGFSRSIHKWALCIIWRTVASPLFRSTFGYRSWLKKPKQVTRGIFWPHPGVIFMQGGDKGAAIPIITVWRYSNTGCDIGCCFWNTKNRKKKPCSTEQEIHKAYETAHNSKTIRTRTGHTLGGKNEAGTKTMQNVAPPKSCETQMTRTTYASTSHGFCVFVAFYGCHSLC